MGRPGIAARRRAIRSTAPIAVAVAILASLSGLPACGGDDGGDGPDMTRVAWARVYQHGGSTLPKQTPASVAKALAGLEPTWVTGLVRLEQGEKPTNAEVSAYGEIRDAVRAKAPNAEFDIELNALEYRSVGEIEATMDELRAKFDNDGWFFDFFTPAYEKRRDVVVAAIADAHEHGEWVGGNTFGWSKDPEDPVIPPDSDYLAVADENFKLDLSAVRKLAENIPILFHLRNNPDNPKSEGCIYIRDYSTGDREEYVRERAREQSGDDYRFAYPVFFPTCLASRHAPSTDIVAFDSIRDGSMLRTIGELMDKYN